MTFSQNEADIFFQRPLQNHPKIICFLFFSYIFLFIFVWKLQKIWVSGFRWNLGCTTHAQSFSKIFKIHLFGCFITQLVRKLHKWSLYEMIKDILPFVLNTKRPLGDIWLLRFKQNNFGCFWKNSEFRFLVRASAWLNTWSCPSVILSSCPFQLAYCLNDQAYFAWFTLGVPRGQLWRKTKLRRSSDNCHRVAIFFPLERFLEGGWMVNK